MQKLSHYFLVLIAGISVILLGYYAYTMATDTYSTPFIGQEQQSGNIIRVAFSKPWIQIGGPKGDTSIDKEALIGSMTKNGKPWNPTLSGEGYMMVSGEYMEIYSSNWSKDDSISISAKEYNATKKTGYKIPRDIKSTSATTNKTLFINQVGLPRDMTYQVTMNGYEKFRSTDIRWYMSTLSDAQAICDINTWNTDTWSQVPVKRISGNVNGNNENAVYQLDLAKYPSGKCMVIGVGGDFYPIKYTHLQNFAVTGNATDILSPEYDMQSRIEFRFSSDIFSDTGALYSNAYIENRQKEKIEFIKKLSISPDINITPENVELTPNKAVVYANMIEGKKYSIDLDKIKDIYGRSENNHLDVTAESVPSLALRINNNNSIIKLGDPINAKLYRTKSENNEYEIKLCRIGLDGYARIERMNELRKKEHTNSLYDLLASKEVSGCTKKTIVMNPGSSSASFDVNSFVDKGLLPGLYVLAFQNKSDLINIEKWTSPKVFSVIDTHITMKIDSSGKVAFLATDIRTGEPRSKQNITLKNNISQVYTQNWNSSKNTYDITYTPLSQASWGTGVVVGKTGTDGTIKKESMGLNGSDLYSLTSEWWGDYEGRYNSFVSISEGGGHFGYVVSTWNDGITGWNFGLKESDYGWENRGLYSAYVHTDRKLYLPGETVYIKAIIRKNESKLTIPENEVFDIVINDPEGKTLSTSRVKANKFGSIASSFILGSGSALGSYQVMIQNVNSTTNWWITGGYTNFQVEIFKNPTFTASVDLSSPEVTDGIIRNIRESANTDPSTAWYQNKFTGKFSLDGIVKAHYYNGAIIKSVPFSYRIYKSPHYNNNYWSDCFWGCYFSPAPEFYTEGTGSIDSDGYGAFRTSVEFSSFSDDYMYTAEVTIADPLSGETVTTPGTLLVGLAGEYKMYDIYNPLQSTIAKRIIKPGENINGVVKPKNGKWDDSLKGKYKYELVHREYQTEKISSLRGDNAPITHTIDTVVKTGDISITAISVDTKGLTPGEYTFRVLPITEKGVKVPDESIHETLIFITGNFVSRDNLLRVIPEKTVYKNGETARVLITTPFSSGGHLYITRERGGIIDHEYVAFSGSTYTREYLVDDSFYPNVYLGVVAFPLGNTENKGYAVGYSEIVTDLSSKKGNLAITTDKKTYKNRDTVNLDISLTDKSGKSRVGEIEIMVIDESLIRLLGNIDLDIIPKFFQKYPFTMKTALTAIGIERNRFLSRKGSNGGSGNKGGDGAQISSRTLFKNTAYYNPSIITDINGKAKVQFQLPDNVTDYRIIAIGQTETSEFSVNELSIAVRRDYTTEIHAPSIGYSGDVTTITASVFNNTPRITPVNITLQIGTGSESYTRSESVILGSSAAISQDFRITINKKWNKDTPYTITVREKGTILDSISRTIDILEFPIITSTTRISGSTNTGTSVPLPGIGKNTDPNSKVILSVSDSPLQNPEKIIASLVAYPYGCIEQTISSTIPNAIALKLSDSLGINIDTKKAQTNLEAGVTKILKMQDWTGGWKYWETDTQSNLHVTPYVIRSLYEMQKLGIKIPNESISKGVEYLANQSIGTDQFDQMDIRAEIFATLAMSKHPKTQEIQNSIRIDALSRHGYLMYHVGLASLGKLGDNEKKNLSIRMSSRDSESYWYWDDTADMAIYARLLIQSGDRTKGISIITDLLRNINLESYYVSTQSKIQLFMALIEIGGKNTPLSFQMDTGALKIPIGLKGKTHRASYDSRRGLIGESLDIKNIVGSGDIFYEIMFYDNPIDIFKMPEITHEDISVSRVFEKVDESKGQDEDGQFLSATPVRDGQFSKGELYRVRLTVTPRSSNKTKYYLTLEDYIPGAWRPIRGIFKTESLSTTDQSSEYGYWNGWTYTEAREDRILATQDYVWQYNKPYTYTYYIRPEHVGTYLLPPTTAYYMYQPEIHAIGKYEKIIVK